MSGRKKDMGMGRAAAGWCLIIWMHSSRCLVPKPYFSHWLDRCSKRNDSHCIHCYICHRWTLNAWAELVWMSWRLLNMRRFQNKTADKGIRQKRLGERGGWEIFNFSLSLSLCQRPRSMKGRCRGNVKAI